jgi:hypothetical protein
MASGDAYTEDQFVEQLAVGLFVELGQPLSHDMK